MPDPKVIIFSKDRAMQLHAAIGSFKLHCLDYERASLSVLYKASTAKHASHYEALFTDFPEVAFFPETNFKRQLLALLGEGYVLFLVDDNLFVHDFYLSECTDYLSSVAGALGFSLRLGKNTTYCYMLNQHQPLPVFEVLDRASYTAKERNYSSNLRVLKFEWAKSVLDFKYPLEVSSSVYKASLLREFLQRLDFHHPNTLEGKMAEDSAAFSANYPNLLCFERSVTFCNPLNKVQDIVPSNRAANQPEMSPERLSSLFAAGLRIDFVKLNNFMPLSCHMEVELSFSSDTIRK